MNDHDFVQSCRAEWKRLGVPDRDAEEMAGDLAADLAAADADGTSIEDFLGSSVSDPRGFATSWAAARGVIPAADTPPGAVHHGRGALIAFTVIAAVVFVAAALLLATGEPRITLLTSGTPARLPGAGGSFVPPPSRTLVSGAAPVEWVLLAFSAIALAYCGWLWFRRGRRAARSETAPAAGV